MRFLGPRQHGRTSRRRLLSAALAAACVAATAAAPAAAADADPGDELIVRFRAAADGDDRVETRREAGARLADRLPVAGMQLLEVRGPAAVEEAIAELERDPDVLYAEPNVVRRRAAVTNDPFLGSLWGLHNEGQLVNGFAGTADADADVVEAWALTRGRRDVAVAVVDSGVATRHPDLAPAIWTNPGESGSGREDNGLDDDGNGLVDDVHGWDWVNGDADAGDDEGHGTHVAGTIAARADDGAGIVGVAPQASVVPLKVLDGEGAGSVADVIEAYGYADRAGIPIVNASLGGTYSQAERDAIAAASDTLFVVAAGNGGGDGIGDDNDDPALADYPCAYPLANIVCVAASTQTDALAPFSNYGSATVDLAAPGTRVLSAQPCTGVDGLTPAYAFYNGTSMATPHAAGTAALMLSAFPGSTAAALKSRLLAAVDPLPAFAATTVSGGRLNAAAAVAGGTAVPAEPADPAPASCATVADDVVEEPIEEGVLDEEEVVDTVAPTVRLRVSSTIRRRLIARRRSLAVALTCSEGCTVAAQLSVGRRVAKRLRLARTGPIVVARGSRLLTADTAGRLTLRLSRRSARALGRARHARATLRLSVADRAGNRRIVRRRLTIRR